MLFSSSVKFTLINLGYAALFHQGKQLTLCFDVLIMIQTVIVYHMPGTSFDVYVTMLVFQIQELFLPPYV